MSASQTALVTGSAIRLGKAIALDLAKAGYHIALHYHSSEAPARETATEIEALGAKCAIFQQDLSQAEGLNDFVAEVYAHFPDLTVLVNSASGYEQASIEHTSPAIFDSQIALNIRAPFFLTQAFASHVGAGNIINIIDNKTSFNQFQYAAYLLAKKALAELTKMAALEFAPDIRVNGVSPGVVLPASVRTDDYIHWRVQAIPLKKQGKPENITRTIRHILENDFITGQIFVVDGGENTAHIGLNAASYPDP